MPDAQTAARDRAKVLREDLRLAEITQVRPYFWWFWSTSVSTFDACGKRTTTVLLLDELGVFGSLHRPCLVVLDDAQETSCFLRANDTQDTLPSLIGAGTTASQCNRVACALDYSCSVVILYLYIHGTSSIRTAVICG